MDKLSIDAKKLINNRQIDYTLNIQKQSQTNGHTKDVQEVIEKKCNSFIREDYSTFKACKISAQRFIAKFRSK